MISLPNLLTLPLWYSDILHLCSEIENWFKSQNQTNTTTLSVLTLSISAGMCGMVSSNSNFLSCERHSSSRISGVQVDSPVRMITRSIIVKLQYRELLRKKSKQVYKISKFTQLGCFKSIFLKTLEVYNQIHMYLLLLFQTWLRLITISFTMQSVICWYHEYKDMWVAVIGEELLQKPELTNIEEDSYVVWLKRLLALWGTYLGKYQLFAPCFYSNLVRSAVVSLGQGVLKILCMLKFTHAW